MPLIIVGSGIAGLTTALAAAPRQVCLLSRAPDSQDSASVLAQGGIAAAVGPNDSTCSHLFDTMRSGSFHNSKPAVRYLVEQAADALNWLGNQGVLFDREGDDFHLAREGGHEFARIAHAGGDASGRAFMQALVGKVKQASHIHWHSETDVDALLLRGNSIAGVRAKNKTGDTEIHEANDVVLATGGLGALFSATSNPPGAEGVGLALGLAAGAAVRDLEFIQFHPTALALGTNFQLPLLTEALRGAGAILRDEHGRAFMTGRHPMADLAPRDLVARVVWKILTKGGNTFLHAQHLGDAWPQRFPTVLASCLAHGIDPRLEPMPVTPAAHFHMGGLATNLDGRTTVPGLWAVGEVACNGVHGANRLASNSLLEGVTYGRRLAMRIKQENVSSNTCGTYCFAERGLETSPSVQHYWRQRLWQTLGPVRQATDIQKALAELQQFGKDIGWRQQLAICLLQAALHRRENLGAHWWAESVDIDKKFALNTH
ncbi:L-aspartate oxidase [Arenimonas maotaiensis]|uniref:L-aspartate oxidase n=1 Tax=Arenimonas maotaiensis TaxID=1446479 RepID=A0A917FHR0_9GAMM|nr:FAD-dependent oxidoreductase [Arenimonas maotaiensis]GGF82202.1 L-aspartate oxidase [Arenimonas maotaiensis]